MTEGQWHRETIRQQAARIEALEAALQHPNLGLATTRELLDELRTRFEIHAAGGLDYRTVGGEEIARAALDKNVNDDPVDKCPVCGINRNSPFPCEHEVDK